MFGLKRMESVHLLGGAFVALHWWLGYFYDAPHGFMFKAFAYPALGAVTAFYSFGVYLREEHQDEMASAAFFAAGAVWFLTAICMGWLPPEKF